MVQTPLWKLYLKVKWSSLMLKAYVYRLTVGADGGKTGFTNGIDCAVGVGAMSEWIGRTRHGRASMGGECLMRSITEPMQKQN